LLAVDDRYKRYVDEGKVLMAYPKLELTHCFDEGG
jgi:hypothetical protein